MTECITEEILDKNIKINNMINRVEIVFKVDDIKVIVYTINKSFNKNDLTKIVSVLTNPVSQKACIN